MKVYLKYEPTDGSPSANMKVTIPASWSDSPVSRVKELFLTHYTKKNPDVAPPLDAASVHLVSHSGAVLPDSALIGANIKEYDEVRIGRGAWQTAGGSGASADAGAGSSASGADADGAVACKNYGCRQRFREEDNAADACKHHTAPPMFHEGKKMWSCCPDSTAWDWEGFMQIGGCAVGRHSTVAPAQLFAVSPTVAAAASAAAAAAASGGAGSCGSAADTGSGAVKSIDDYNAANPDAPTSVTSLAATLAKGPSRKLVVRESDGAKQCIHFGCNKFFLDSDNGPEACVHHEKGPVFWEGSKWWNCCPRKHMEFEAFMAEPGCKRGPHEAGDE